MVSISARFLKREAAAVGGLFLYIPGRLIPDATMRYLKLAWAEIKASFQGKPRSWILFALEAIEITTPTPDHPDAVLKQVEMPNAVNGYSIRELWRWQQLDGPQIEKLCDH